MASDPRNTFYVVKCEKGQKVQLASTDDRRGFFSDLGKVGDLEVLNDIGYGRVGEGLRALVKTSNSVRTGDPQSAVISNVSDENGPSYVYDTVGISPAAAHQASTLNPSVANIAYDQAKTIFAKVKQGNFDVNDIPEVFSDLQNLFTLTNGIYTDPSFESRQFELCGASPYAMDLISWAPKYKFLFVVQFEFTQAYIEAFSDLKAAFVVKNSSRPNVNFEYEEVNMYNFWTKVPKRTIYENMSMRFYDDNKNQAMSLFNAYLRSMSPISNVDNIDTTVRGIYEAGSMDFTGMYKSTPGIGTSGGKTHAYTASYGPTANVDTMNIFSKITLFHVYREGRLMNVYKFFNPKIVSMDLDELDMAEGQTGNEVNIQFTYDGLNITTNVPVDNEVYNMEQLSGGAYGATYKLKDNSKTMTSDPGAVSGPLQPSMSSLASSSQVAAGATLGSLDSGRSLISDATSKVNDFSGSNFI